MYCKDSHFSLISKIILSFFVKFTAVKFGIVDFFLILANEKPPVACGGGVLAQTEAKKKEKRLLLFSLGFWRGLVPVFPIRDNVLVILVKEIHDILEFLKEIECVACVEIG